MITPARRVVTPFFLYLCVLGSATADDSQTTSAAPTESEAAIYSSRAEEIEAARKRKAQNLTTPEQSGLERALLYIKDSRLLDKWKYGWAGFKPRIGALVTGSGFAIGPEFLRDDLKGGSIAVRVTIQASAHLYELYDAELSFPRLADDHGFFAVEARYRNYPRMQYYGPGPKSQKTGRSDYRYEDHSYGFATGLRPARSIRLGVLGDYMRVNVGPGTDDRYISTDLQYSPAQTPGIDRQTSFLQGGVFADYDTRDIPGGARSGTLLHAQYLYNKDVDLERNTHKRLNLEGQQYIPLFNSRRVIALRARSELTWKNPGQEVPFYLQPQLGGSNDLRGFCPFRFYDDNLIVFNAEYRYEIFAGLDMAIFGDAGKVFHSKKDWNVDDLEGSWGVGMRFNARNAVFMRIDAGFSREGFQVWVKFNNVF